MKRLIFLLLLPGSLAWAQPGTSDPTFGQSGVSLQTFTITRDSYGDIAQGADGSLFVTGSTGFTYDYLLAKYTPNGILDSSFSENGWEQFDQIGSTDQGRAIAIQNDGKILIAGGSVNANRDWGILRVDSAGGQDSSFGQDGWVLLDWGGYDEASDIVVQPDGKILVAGGGNFTLALARLKPNGTLDSTFGVNGRVSYPEGGNPALALASDGSIYVADAFANGSSAGYGVLKYTPLGQLDASFGTGGKVISDVTSFPSSPLIALQPDGKVIFGGTAGSSGGASAGFALVRVLGSGSPDPAFSGDGKVLISSGSATEGNGITLLSNGHILVAGAAAPNGNADMALFCIRPDGSIESGFGSNGVARLNIGGNGEWAQDVVVQSDGKIVIAGSHSDGFTKIAMARFQGGGLSSVGQSLMALDFQVFPNPVRNRLHFRAVLPAAAVVTFSLIDFSGKTVYLADMGKRPAGLLEQEAGLPEGIAPGLYMGVLRAGEISQARLLRVE